MNATEVNSMIQYHIGVPHSRTVNSTILSSTQTEAINQLALILYAACPEYFEKQTSLTSTTNIFTLPTDLIHLKSVWDLDTNANDITGAADNGATLIRITDTAHGYSDGDIITIHDVGGTTEANGTWSITYVDANTYDLVGSTFATVYTSGGKSFHQHDDIYSYPLTRIPSENQASSNETHYLLRENTIIVDDPDFTNDLLITYRYLPSTLAEIPTRMHDGIWAYGVLKLLRIPSTGTPDYPDVQKTINLATSVWQSATTQARAFSPIHETRTRSRKVSSWL